MSSFVKVVEVEKLPPGERLWHDFEEETVIIFNVDGEFFAIADLCTHDDGPLGDGVLRGHEVECPRHGARFDVRTGTAICFPAFTGVPTYTVKVEDGSVFVESPDD